MPANVIRGVESRIAKTERALENSEAKAGAALELHVETGRAEPKELWKKHVVTSDELRAELERLGKELIVARGTVSPEQHQARVMALRISMEDPDEGTRFEARARVMQALGELVTTLDFHADPPAILINMHGWATYIRDNQFVDGVFDPNIEN